MSHFHVHACAKLLCKYLFVAMGAAHLVAHASPSLHRVCGVAVLAVLVQWTSPGKNSLCPCCLNEVSSHGNHILSAEMHVVF